MVSGSNLPVGGLSGLTFSVRVDRGRPDSGRKGIPVPGGGRPDGAAALHRGGRTGRHAGRRSCRFAADALPHLRHFAWEPGSPSVKNRHKYRAGRNQLLSRVITGVTSVLCLQIDRFRDFPSGMTSGPESNQIFASQQEDKIVAGARVQPDEGEAECRLQFAPVVADLDNQKALGIQVFRGFKEQDSYPSSSLRHWPVPVRVHDDTPRVGRPSRQR